MLLKIHNKVITSPIEDTLKLLRSELTNGKLRDIHTTGGDNVAVTCPCHKGGFELKPSCFVYTKKDDPITEYGYAHCFTCGYKASFPRFISDCLDENDIEVGEQWLLENCDVSFLSEHFFLPSIELDNKVEVEPGMDESILKNYEYYHDYMWKRKLSKEIVDLFEVGYDPKTEAITFPVRDEKGILRFITSRSVKSKLFTIPPGVQKPVYLLYYLKQHNITTAVVCESQINALTAWSHGIPSIALFGTGTPYQYEILKKSGIRRFILMFDGDDAGRKGAERFKRNMSRDIFIDDIIVPTGKDVNDLTKDEVLNLIKNCI